MANSAQAKKRVRQAATATLANQSCLSRVRTHRKNAEMAISKADYAEAMTQFKLLWFMQAERLKKTF